MKELKEIPLKIKEKLKKDEEIIWHHSIYTSLSKTANYPLIFILGLLFIFLFVTLYKLHFEISLFILIIILIFFCILYFVQQFKGKFFVVTNKRTYLFIDMPWNHVQAYSHDRIFKLSYESLNPNGQSELVLFTSPKTTINADHSYFPKITFNGLSDEMKKNARTKITDTWFAQSPYQKTIQHFKLLAEKYNLNYQPFHPDKNLSLIIDGTINGKSIYFELIGLFELKKILISISCANPKHQHILIAPEGFGYRVNKLFGAQDYIIGNKLFDERFIIQGDKALIEEILNEERINQYLNATHFLPGKLDFGYKNEKKVKPKIRKNKSQESLLDDDLLADLNEEENSIKDENNRDFLSYRCNDIFEVNQDVSKVMNKINNLFEMMIEIADDIENGE